MSQGKTGRGVSGEREQSYLQELTADTVEARTIMDRAGEKDDGYPQQPAEKIDFVISASTGDGALKI